MKTVKKFVVFDIGGTKIRRAVWDGQSLSHIESFSTPKVTASEFLKELLVRIQSLPDQEVCGVGVSTAGPVDVVQGCIRNPANLGNGDASWMNFQLKDDLSQKTGLPVCLDNDAAMTAWGQFKHYEDNQMQDLLLLTLGTGLGVGAIVNGVLARGGQNMHPELGHFIIADQPDESYQSPFLNFPTLESYLSGHHFSQRVGQALGEQWDGNQLIQQSHKQDPRVMKMWGEYSRRMAVALSNLYLAYFPKKIVLAGGFAKAASPFFLNSAVDLMGELLKGRGEAGMPIPSVQVSEHHNELPLLGAGYRIQNFYANRTEQAKELSPCI